MRQLHRFLLMLIAFLCCGMASLSAAADEWLTYSGGEGPGKGKDIVFIAAEEAYRSELSMPLMARILSRQGFRCTVLFAIDPKTGTIDPRVNNNIPGLEVLDSADLLVAFLRWRELPDDQMKHIIDARSDVAITGTYEPGPAGASGLKTGVKPDDPSF